MNWKSLHGEAFADRRVLVTGGGGFIGSHLIQALTALDARVTAIDDLSGGSWANLNGFGSDVRKFTASILDPEALSDAIAGCEYVFHQAALGSVPLSVEQPRRYQQVNAAGTLAVLEAARGTGEEKGGVRRVVYAGSSSAYGDPPVEGSKVETMPPLPRSPYAAAKLSGEHLIRAWAHSYSLDTAVLRYFNIFGPRQNANSAYAAVIAAFAKALIVGEQGVIFGDGEQSRDFTFVENAVHANLLAARHPGPLQGEVYNVATGRRVSVNDLYRKMARLLGREHASPMHHPPRSGDVKHSLADIRKAQNTLGYHPLIDFETGLERTTAWYQQQLSMK